MELESANLIFTKKFSHLEILILEIYIIKNSTAV